MSSTTITLDIHGRPYHLQCEEGEELELEALAGELSDRLATLDDGFGAQADTVTSENMRLVITSLMILGELRESKQYTRHKSSQNREEVEEVIADTLERIAGKLETLAS